MQVGTFELRLFVEGYAVGLGTLAALRISSDVPFCNSVVDPRKEVAGHAERAIPTALREFDLDTRLPYITTGQSP